MANVPPATDQPDLADDVPDGDKKDHRKSRYDNWLEAWLERWKEQWTANATQLALEETRDDTRIATEQASLKAIEDAYIATAQSSLDRALTRMNVVTASVSAVIGIYTALLAYVYTTANTATGGTNQPSPSPLTSEALIPALFLGSSLLLVTIYAALFRSKTTVGPLLPTGVGGLVREMRLATYMKWCFAGVLARRWALHAGIVSLGLGIATLPIPFLAGVSPEEAWWYFAGGALAVIAIGAFTAYKSRDG